MEKLLAVITDWENGERVLERTQYLADKLHADFAVYRPVHAQLGEMQKYIGFDDFERLRDQIMVEERHQLSAFCEGKTADFHSEWCERVHLAISGEAERQGAGLVVMAASRHGVLANLAHRADDWHLLRELTCPVLMLPETNALPDKVVAAVDCLDDDDEHQQLAERVLDSARAFSKAFAVPLTAITVTPDPALIYANLVSVPFNMDFQAEADKRARESLQRLLDRMGLTVDSVRVEAGRVEGIVTDAAEDGLLVIGSAANQGLKGMFLGNTAERILHHMKTEMLVVN